MRNSTSYADASLKMGNIFAFATAFFYIHIYNAIAVLVTCTPEQGYIKSHFSALIDQGLNPGHFHGTQLSGANRKFESKSSSLSRKLLGCKAKCYAYSSTDEKPI
jgi:hypothetical protein